MESVTTGVRRDFYPESERVSQLARRRAPAARLGDLQRYDHSSNTILSLDHRQMGSSLYKIRRANMHVQGDNLVVEENAHHTEDTPYVIRGQPLNAHTVTNAHTALSNGLRRHLLK